MSSNKKKKAVERSKREQISKQNESSYNKRLSEWMDKYSSDSPNYEFKNTEVKKSNNPVYGEVEYTPKKTYYGGFTPSNTNSGGAIPSRLTTEDYRNAANAYIANRQQSYVPKLARNYNPNWRPTERKSAEQYAAEHEQRLQAKSNEIAGYGKYFSANDFKSGVAVGQHKYEAANKRERESTPGFWDIFNGAMGSGNAIITSKQAEDIQRADTIASVDAMTDDERDIYYYLLGTRGDSEAEKFRSLLQESLNYRIGTKDAALDKEVGTSGILPFIAGVDSAFAGMTNAVSGAFGGSMVPTSPLQYEYKAWREGLKPVRGAINDVAYTGGNMLPSVGASYALGGMGLPSVLGTGVLGVSAAGNAYKEGVDSGYSHDEALTYGVLTGASEAGLQAVLGGISNLGLGITEEAAGGAISRALGKVIKNTGVTDAIGRYIANMGSEATEEYLQSLLEPVFKNVVAGEQNEFNPLDEEALYSGLMGALTAGLFEAPNLALDIGGARYAEREFNAARNSMQQENTAAQEQSPVDIQREAAQGVAGNEVEPPAAVNRTPANEDINRVAEAAAKAAQTQPPTNIQEAAAQAAENAAQSPSEKQTSNNAAAPAKPVQNGVATRHTATTSNGNAVSVGSIVDTDNGLNVRLSDGTTAQLSDVDFDDPNINVLYERAASLDADTANALVNNYTGETSVDNYLRGFNSVYLSGKQGYEYAKAVGDSVYARHYLNDNARMAAFRAGQAAYQSSRANSIAGQQGNNVRPQAKAEYEAGVNREYSDRKLTSSQRKQIRALDEVFKAAGKKLVIHDSIGTDGNSVTFSRSDANAYYDAKTDTYHLSLDSTGQAYAYVVAHESIHEMEVKNKEGFSALSEVVEAAIEGELMNQKGMTFDEAKAEFEKMVQYQIDKNGLSRSEAVTEVVANTVPAILTDEQQGKRFADKVMKSGSKVKAWFEQLIKDLREILNKAYNILKGQKSWEQMELIRNNKQTLDMIADYYFEGMEGTKGKAANGDGSARYSIQTTENGKQYVEADRNVISGDNPSEWARQVEDYINNEIRHGRDVTVYSANGVPLTITADTAGKAIFRNFVDMPNGKRRLMTNEEYAVKLRAESHIDELAQVSRGTGTRKIDKKNHSFARDGFDYRTAYFKDNTGYYELLISIGKQGRINTVYNVGRIKEADFPTMGLKGPGRSKTETRNTASIDNMPQSPENVKLSAKDSGADIREVNPMEITPPNRVTSSSKYHYLINEFENNGYNGRNVVLVENGNDGYQALTGSHRILAAREAGVDVPSVVIPMSEEIQPLLDATGDEERARIADELYEDGVIPKEARDLLVREDELNFENLGKPLDKQARFSMKDTVEETRDLIAVHNLKGDELEADIELGGFPMPSIAITKPELGHSEFGDISLIFGKDTIDPKRSGNKVYNADAYTPTFPQVGYKPNEKSIKRLRDLYYKVYEKAGSDIAYPLYAFGVDDAGEAIARYGGSEQAIVKSFADNTDMMQAYLVDQGKQPIETIQREVVTEIGEPEKERYDFILNKLGKDAFEAMGTGTSRATWYEKYGESYREALKQQLIDAGIDSETAASVVADGFSRGDVLTDAIKVRSYMQNGPRRVKTQPDLAATQKAIKEAVNPSEYKAWLENTFSGVVSKKGIRNDKDMFTNSGNRRSFETLYWEFNLENIVKAMKSQDEKGASGLGTKSIFGSSAREYESIADIKADSNRLQTLNEEQYAAIKETYSNRFREIVDTYAGNKDWWDAATTLCEAVARRKTRTGIYNYLNQWPQVYKASYDIVDSLISLTQDIAKMPTEYFEAKPQRAVSFDEVRAVIMPEGKYEDLQTALESRGIPVETYNPDVEGERLSKLNSEFTERFRFSRKDDVSVTPEDAKKLQKQNDKLQQALEVAKQEIKLSDGHHVKASAVERLAGSLLKEYSSKMDKAELVSNITELFDYIGNGENVVWDEVQAGAMNIALNVLDQSSKRNTEWYDNTKPAREFLKNNTIKLNEKQLAEVQSAFGSYTEFRRELYNKAKFSKTEGISLEQAWRDLSSMFPDTFDPDTPDVDMPTLLHDEVLNMYDRPIENPYGYGMNEYAADLAMRLYGEYMAMPERKTFADKQQKKLEMQRARYNTLMEQQREQAKAKYEKLRDQRDITKYKTSIEKNAKSLYSWLTKPNNSKHVPEALRNKTADLLKTLEFDGKKGHMWKDAMRNLQTWMQQVDRAKTNPDIDNPLIEYAPDLIDNMQSLLDSASKYNNISDMPLDKLKELNNIVAAVKHTVTTANTVIADGRRQYIDDIGGNIIKTAQVQRPKAREFMRKHPYAYKMASVVSGFFNSGNVKPIYFFDNIGGEMKTLFNDVRQASYKAALTANTIRGEYAQIKDKYHYKEWADKAGDWLTIQTKGGGNVSITREQALDIYATAKREKLIGTQHLTKDGFVFDKDVVQKNGKLIETATNDNVNKPLSEETIAEISDWLTKEQKGYADALVELMSTKGAELGNEVTMLMYGINRFAESYYIPIMSSRQFIETAFNGRVSEAMSWMNKGFTKNTVARARNPIVITGITQKALQHMADMAIYNAMAIPQDTMAKVYNYKQWGEDGGANTYIRAELDKAYGQHTSKYIKTFINDISGNITVDPRDSMASKMISAFRRNAISGKLSVAIQQPSAIVRATALVDPKYFFGHVDKNTYDTAKKYSGTAVIKEVGGFDAYTGKGLVQWMADNDKLNFRNVREAVAGWLPQKMDEITWCRIWKACENEVADTTAFERGSEEFYKAVGHRFDDVIEYTQVYDSAISRSEYMRSKSAGAKLFTSFKAEPTVSYNMYWYALKHMNEKGGRARLLRAAASIIGAGVFNAILKSIITAVRDKDENQNYIDKYVEALAGNLVGTPLKKVPYIGEYIYLGGELDTLGSLPLVNEVLSMLQGYTSSRSELKVMQDLINAAGDLDNEKKGLDERLLRMAKATSQMFGIPLDAAISDWFGVVREVYKTITGNQPELSGNIMYEIREGLGVKQELELYKGVDKAITTGDYTRLDKQFKTMVERDTTTDPTKKARETVRAAVRQYFDAGEVKAGDAKRILVRCGYKMDDAEAMITKWDFWRDYPEAHDMSIEDGTETLAAKYFEYAKPANIDKTLFYDVYKFNGSAKADKDKNGNSIRNSKRDKVADYINKQRLTKAQKDALWFACGYKESTLDEAPWR